MNPSELFDRCVQLTQAEPTAAALHYLHETLVLACAEALHDSSQAYGNLFSQVDYLCRRRAMPVADRMAVQAMRHHSNGTATSREDLLYDVRALSLFVSAVFAADIPHDLLTRIPRQNRPTDHAMQVNQRYLRCIVTSWDDQTLYASTDRGPVSVTLADDSLRSLLSEGMQLNLLDSHRQGTSVVPQLVVVEPDFLVDISSVAACFTDYGHHPLAYLVNRLKPRPQSQAILLGNLAGDALDDIINHADYDVRQTLRQSFREQALQFATCTPFAPEQFKADAALQAAHIREAVSVLFPDRHDRAVLEPSFVCEQLGLQGRVDLMTTDLRLLVEQKSGKNWNIERMAAHRPPLGPHLYREDHYVQLLLYYGVLRYNFHLSADRADIRLLYSKYPARQGLLVASFYQELFREAIRLRNRIVAQEIGLARHGFGSIMPLLHADTLLEQPQRRDFFDRYVRGEAEAVMGALHRLSAAERDYVERMLTFVYREQLARKVGTHEGQDRAAADLWNMPLSEKRSTGNIFTRLVMEHRERSAPQRGYDRLTFRTDEADDDFLPNFRRGDMVYVYAYDDEPDVRRHMLFKGVLERLTDSRVTVRLTDGQQNPHVFPDSLYAIEHAHSDASTTAAVRSLHAFCRAPQHKRDLLLGLRPPRADAARTLTRSYHPHYDELLLRSRQALDYFLLQGPPGTGKTSMALRFMVEEELASTTAPGGAHLLLTAFTNRAVDEICAMLTDAGIDFLRLGNEASCDPRFASRLLEHALDRCPRLDDIRAFIMAMPVIVSTTSTLLAHPEVFRLKRFTLCIVDEASQILEPGLVGILSSDRVERFVLIGDHKQLPAVVQQPDDEPRLSGCRRSLFERLLGIEQAQGRHQFTGILRRQGRMHPDVAAFPCEMFYRREQLQCVPCPHQQEARLPYDAPSEDWMDDLLKQQRVLFFPTQPEPPGTLLINNKVSGAEARLVADLLRRIYRQYGPERFDPDRTAGVIVPYRNQIALIRKELAALGIPQLTALSVDTVERYQGSQRDVIIYSFTVQQPHQLDFLTASSFEEDGHTIDRKLNVAMTRARRQLLMTGLPEVLRGNPLFGELISRYDYHHFIR